ncbi:MAG: glycosylase [Candidatus Diapherotrites archaeon]|nr:glycosylase [Candidatus Micrarchaeota archaeon]MBU1939742.1 glycosylase [Candidatus Micrarchaeota archaeon]
MKTNAKLLLTPSQIMPSMKSMRVRGVFNPGAVRLKNKKIMLFARVAETPYHDDKTFIAPRFAGKARSHVIIEKIGRDKIEEHEGVFKIGEDIYRLPTLSHLRKILLDRSGMEVEEISGDFDFAGMSEDGDFGVEDPRITYFAREKRYAMTYVSVSMSSGVSTSLALSRDLAKWDRKGVIFRQQNKDVVLFPEKIGGYYVALHRPEGTMIFDKPSIWLSYSRDLIFWGKDVPLMKPRNSGWERLRIGAGTVPIKTDEGWLEIYHGVQPKRAKNGDITKVYSAGAVLLDSKRPDKVLRITPAKEPLFAPKYKFEREGFVGGVVFPTAAIPDLDGKSLLIYSGAADSCTTVRKIKIRAILNSLR